MYIKLNYIIMFKTVINVVRYPFGVVYNFSSMLNSALLPSNEVLGPVEGQWPAKIGTKVIGTTVGVFNGSRGVEDAIESFVCRDNLCFAVSCIGISADVVQFAASFTPAINATTLVTIPVSRGCKYFVWYCQNVKGVFGGCI